ncbi:MAG: succinylglutamate desuccinylase/aspartoacylase family protein [Proteobacteria bacterium]|nr:succinylglutamate desuccinylase/aspartoacylase family protein [Pseudomonadota bacterium]
MQIRSHHGTVEREIDRFDAALLRLALDYDVDVLGGRICVVKPRGGPEILPKKDIWLTLLGGVHGVEVAGITIINCVLEQIIGGKLPLEGPLGVALGNVPAVLAGKRYVERDLNRSFGRHARDYLEEVRADELESLLVRTKYLVDFHQVKHPTVSPFWIFPYHPEGYSFARAIAGNIPIITHWGGGFSSDGQCTDEFVMNQNGCGVTIELGQNGFDQAQIDLGVRVAIAAIGDSQRRITGATRGPRQEDPTGGLYTWGEVVPYPETGSPVLDPGWQNFAPVTKGQRLGSYGGKIIAASVSGWILFPKYPEANVDGSFASKPPAAELVRILTEINEEDLPVKGVSQ